MPEEPEVERLSLAFRFEETDEYMGSVALLSLAIVAATGLLPWIIASLAVTALGLGSGFYYYQSYRGRLGPTPPLLPSPPPVPTYQGIALPDVGRRRLRTTA